MRGVSLPDWRHAWRSLEDWWFDTRLRVDTRGEGVPHRAADVVGSARDGYVYAPARARNVVAALNELPARDLNSYTFIDLGSGKGRVVLIAAEKPFKQVVGVEYSRALHTMATENLRSVRKLARPLAPISLVLADAADFEFPAGKLVLHLFNPFGPEVMNRVLANLRCALEGEKRQVYVILLWPELSHMVQDMPEMTLYRHTRRFEIYVARSA